MNETLELARFASGLQYQDIPPSVVQSVKGYLLDCLGCGISASGLPWSRMVAAQTQESGAIGPCTVLGREWMTSAPYAALANGTMIGGFETDHVYSIGSCHPGASVVPALLAASEREHAAGQDLLAAAVAGYEVVCRIGSAATRAVEDVAGFHGPATNGPFGGAIAAARALGLDATQTASALGIAGSSSGGLLEFSNDGSMIKRLHMGRASQLGLEAALLARRGFTGPHAVLEGTRGFLKVFSPDPHPERLVDGLGERYVTGTDLLIKSYPCHIRAHPFVDALVRFKGQTSLEPDRVRSVHLHLSAHDAHRHGQREPTTLLDAQYSIPYSVAVALWRDLGDPLAFDDDALRHEGIRRTAALIDLVHLEDATELTTPSLVLDLGDETHRLDCSSFKGSASDPYSYEDLRDKFLRYATPVLGAEAAERVVATVESLEEVTDIAQLTSLLRFASR